METFAWLADPYRRRSTLLEVERAVRLGWLDGPGRAGNRACLVRVLEELVADPSVRPREMLRVARILRVMLERDLDKQRKEITA